jgi:hypothetical protein
MADATTTKLLKLLHAASAELRAATALILGEVGSRSPDITQALCAAIDDADAAVRLQALAAVGKLRIEPALASLLQRIEAGGVESEAAALAAAKLGAKGTSALRNLMSRVAPGLRRRIAGALAAAGTASSETAAIETLLDSDPGVVDASVRSLIAEVPALTPAHRKDLADHLLELLRRAKKKALPLATETAAIRLLAALGDGQAEALFWERIQPLQPTELRAVSLQALGNLAPTPNKDHLRTLFACAGEADFRVAAPALMMLKNLPVTAKTASDWLPLFDAPDVGVRRLALEKVGDFDVAAVAAALVRQVHHPDRELRDAAVGRLARLKQGRKALADALLDASTPDAAWSLVRAQAPLVKDQPKDFTDRVFEKAGKHLEAGDRRADALLFLLREENAAWLRDRLEERALALRKKKKYDTALVYLKLLGRDPACGPALRFELAACGLKLSGKDLSAEARAADPPLQQFAGLLSSHPEETTAALDKAKWLDPEDLFYLGFHFAEKERQEKQFGGHVLGLILKRSPKSKVAKDAKSKLRREGLD